MSWVNLIGCVFIRVASGDTASPRDDPRESLSHHPMQQMIGMVDFLRFRQRSPFAAGSGILATSLFRLKSLFHSGACYIRVQQYYRTSIEWQLMAECREKRG